MKQIDFKEINSRGYTKKSYYSQNPHHNKLESSIPQKQVKSGKSNKRKHQTYQEAYNELNEYISKVILFTQRYIETKKREKGLFGRIISKILRVDEDEREAWIEEVAESRQIQDWMWKIDNLLDFIVTFYNRDLTDYVENRLGNLFPDFY